MHAHPPATTHTPWQPCMPPRQPRMPPCNHTRPPVNRMTNRCKNITLPQTSFAGGNNRLAHLLWEVLEPPPEFFTSTQKVGNVLIKGFYSRGQKLPPVGSSCQGPLEVTFVAAVKTFDDNRGHFALIVKNSFVVQSCAKMLWSWWNIGIRTWTWM